jgi:mannose-1-phosphate guanylyltransferase
MSICAVIMAGGSGTRLWPVSRAMHPKQFLALNDEDTMIQATVKRLSGIDVDSSITICNQEHRFFVAEQLREINQLGSIILEPVGRNTAPAIALAALAAKDDPLLLVLAADHVIKDEAAFSKAVSEAIPLAESGRLVTFGIVPTEPNTGYGYIKRGQKQGTGFTICSFVEKPPAETAKQYVDSGDYYWNSGMFLFRASRYLEELKKYRSDIFEACEGAMRETKNDLDFVRIDEDFFNSCPSESIDYAVMENG